MSAGGAKAARRAESRWSKALSTPLLQLLRGRITGEISIDSVVRDADLPERASALARRVARRTRLYRWERIDLARELAAHFREGLDAGRSGDELIESFGDERAAARLIRRAKQRSRHPLLRVMRRARQVCVVLIVVLSAVYLVFAIPYWTGEPKPTRNFVLEINAAALAVPEEERAWPVYREAYLAMEVPHPRELDLSARPGSPGWEEAAQFVRERGDALDTVRRATSIPELGYILIEGIHREDSEVFGGDPDKGWRSEQLDDQALLTMAMYDVLLPHLHPLLMFAKALRIEAYTSVNKGDDDPLALNIQTILRLAAHARSHGLVLNDIVSIRIVDEGVALVMDAVTDHSGEISDAHLVAIAHLLITADTAELLRIRTEFERLAFEDFLQRTYTPRGSIRSGGLAIFLDGETTSEVSRSMRIIDGLLGPVASALLPTKGESLRMFDRTLNEHEAVRHRPMWEWDGHMYYEPPGSWLIEARRDWALHTMPAFGRAQQIVEQSIQQRDAALVAIALELFRREHGGWPASLDELVPRFLPSVPRDRFDGGPIKYALRDGAPVVYSIGANREDNGGVAPTIYGRPVVGAVTRWAPIDQVEAQREAVARGEEPAHRLIPEGDWILFPPVRPGPFDPYGDLREGVQDDPDEGEEG